MSKESLNRVWPGRKNCFNLIGITFGWYEINKGWAESWAEAIGRLNIWGRERGRDRLGFICVCLISQRKNKKGGMGIVLFKEMTTGWVEEKKRKSFPFSPALLLFKGLSLPPPRFVLLPLGYFDVFPFPSFLSSSDSILDRNGVVWKGFEETWGRWMMRNGYTAEWKQ